MLSTHIRILTGVFLSVRSLVSKYNINALPYHAKVLLERIQRRIENILKRLDDMYRQDQPNLQQLSESSLELQELRAEYLRIVKAVQKEVHSTDYEKEKTADEQIASLSHQIEQAGTELVKARQRGASAAVVETISQKLQQLRTKRNQ